MTCEDATPEPMTIRRPTWVAWNYDAHVGQRNGTHPGRNSVGVGRNWCAGVTDRGTETHTHAQDAQEPLGDASGRIQGGQIGVN